MISSEYPKGYPHCRECGKVVEDCGCPDDTVLKLYYPEAGETRSSKDPVERVAAVLGTPGSTPLLVNDHWVEVRCCHGEDLCVVVDGDPTPALYVVRGGQMYKLIWGTTPLPEVNQSLIARPDV